VQAAGRRHEVAPGDVVGGCGHPLLRACDIGRTLACAEQPAVDLAHGRDAGDLPTRDRGHRLVEQRHPLGNAPGVHVRVAQQGERAELQVCVAEAPRDRERFLREPLAFPRVARPGRAVERQPAVRGALLHPLEEARGSRHPPVGGGHVAVDGTVQEREPARQLCGLHAPAAAPVCGERALLELDRPVVLALEVRRPAQAVEGLGGLVELERPLEARARPLPVGCGERLPTGLEEVVCGVQVHRGTDRTARPAREEEGRPRLGRAIRGNPARPARAGRASGPRRRQGH
jgi:hypothetical protein